MGADMTQRLYLAEAAQRAYDLGFEYEQVYRGCGQCAIAAVIDTLGLTDGNEVFRAATAFAAGVGMMGDGSCGGYLGGVLLLGHLGGREKNDFLDEAGVRFQTYDLAREYHDRFIAKYGSVTCRDIHMNVFGRSFFLRDRDDFIKFEEAGGHVEKCPAVVADATKWAVELIIREGLVGKT